MKALQGASVGSGPQGSCPPGLGACGQAGSESRTRSDTNKQTNEQGVYFGKNTLLAFLYSMRLLQADLLRLPVE